MGRSAWMGIGMALVLAMLMPGCEATPDPPDTPATAPEATARPRVVALLPVPSPPVPLDQCSETSGTVRSVPLPIGSREHWYGAGPLWVDLSRIRTGPVEPDVGLRVRWVTFVDGNLTADVSRVDGSGEGTVHVYRAEAEGHRVWAGEVRLPTQGCWLVTAKVGDVSLGFVMRS